MHAPADAHPDDRVQQRLTELEIKASYAEDTLDRLNDVIVRQQAQIDALVRELALLHQQAPAADAPVFRSLRDDLPPHY
jgi:SlyX protein